MERDAGEGLCSAQRQPPGLGKLMQGDDGGEEGQIALHGAVFHSSCRSFLCFLGTPCFAKGNIHLPRYLQICKM